MKLYVKILLLILVLIAAALYANIHFTRLEVTSAMSDHITSLAELTASEMEGDLRKALLSGNEMESIRTLQTFADKTGAAYAGLISPEGRVIAHTNVAMTGSTESDPAFRQSVKTARPNAARILHGGDEIVDSVIPLRPPVSGEDLLFGTGEGDAPIGFLRAGLPLMHAAALEKRIILNLLLLALAIAGVAVLVTALASRMLLRQVSLLEEGIKKSRGGDFTAKVRVVTSDELGEVANSFNKLLADLDNTTVSMRYLDAMIQSLPDPLIITDEAGHVIKANRAACDFSGYDFAGEEKFNVRDILEQQTEGAADPFSMLSWNGRVGELDLWLKTREGLRRPVMMSAGFIEAHQRREIILLLKDTSQHREAEARMSQYTKEVETVNNELDSFAHTVSHDLKEPLRGIEMFSGMLLSDHADKLDQQGADYLGRISKAAARMRRLIDDLLGYARLSRVRNPYEESATGALAADAAASLSPLISERKASVTVQEDLPVLYCDPIKMRQLFYNLISNAVRYNDKPEPKVEIRAEKFGEYYWKFTVRDNGIGIPSQYFEDVFKIFKRLHGRQEYGGGTGAGLAIVKKIVEEHNGKVWIESEEGEGSAFFVLLPSDLRKKP